MSNIDLAGATTCETRSVALSGAQAMIRAALECAEELDCRVSVVVLDAGGNVTALARRDGTAATVTTVAQNKANTALTLGVGTDVFVKAIEGNPVLVTSLAAQPGMALIAGGLPLTSDGTVVGAIGISGGRDGKDLLIARAGAAALGS